MNEFVNKLINLLKPTIKDLDEKNAELSDKSKTLCEVEKMLKEINGNISKISKYENQDLILSNLGNINTTEKEYKACCYLLESEDKGIRSLPQYIESSNYIERLINYFKKLKEELTVEVSKLEEICGDKALNKKYLEIFDGDNPFVDDAVEFSDFLNKQPLSENDKIDLLVYVIKNNVNCYLGKSKGR